MELNFNGKHITLIPNSTKEEHGRIITKITQGAYAHTFKHTRGSQKDNAKIAFHIVADIGKNLLGLECEATDFSMHVNGHMVKIGDYDSYGQNAEQSKNRVKDGFDKVVTVEFYIRHALLALEHKANGVKPLGQNRPALL